MLVCLSKSVSSLKFSLHIWTLFSHMITGLFYVCFFFLFVFYIRPNMRFTSKYWWPQIFEAHFSGASVYFDYLYNSKMHIYCNNLIFSFTLILLFVIFYEFLVLLNYTLWHCLTLCWWLFYVDFPSLEVPVHSFGLIFKWWLFRFSYI